MEGKFSYWKFVAAFAAIVLIVAGGYFVWSKYFAYDPVKAYEEAEKRYIAAMTADTYGGKTPQETLDMFVAALRAEDIELASKYFLLDENLSREKWVVLLSDMKSRSVLERLADDITTKATAGNISSDQQFGYVLRNVDGSIGIQIDLRLNRYSGLWKIENL